MDFRPCPRCCKLLPSEAAFCRRCGVAVQARAARAASPVTPPDARLGSRWASTLGTAATAALGVVLALFAVSGPRTAVREGETLLPPLIPREPRVSIEPSRRARPARLMIPADGPPPPPARCLPRDIGLPPFAARNPVRSAGPKITSVTAAGGRPGDRVTIRGSRLGECRQVMFVGTDRGRTAAKFVIWDDEQLIASVPDLGAWPQEAALVVLGDDGVAVTVPATAPAVDSTVALTPRGTVCVVPPGAVFAGQDAPLVVVEGGGAARAARGATLFARSGGCFWGHGGGDCLLYCERGVLRRSDVSACDVVEVEAVNPCVVPSLFHYAGR
jgi:hypothetical protein